jgi:hypothetical protein
LRDFANKSVSVREIGDLDREITITSQQLCEYLDAAETKVARLESLSEDSIAPGLKKRKRSETPSEHITSGDEAGYAEQEQKIAKRLAQEDSDYESPSMKSSSE